MHTNLLTLSWNDPLGRGLLPRAVMPANTLAVNLLLLEVKQPSLIFYGLQPLLILRYSLQRRGHRPMFALKCFFDMGLEKCLLKCRCSKYARNSKSGTRPTETSRRNPHIELR
jgi:hypothetical protein